MLSCLSKALRQCSSDRQLTVSGTIKCNGEGIPFSHINLVHRISFMRNFLGNATTDENGEFELKGVPIDFPQSDASTLAVHVTYIHYPRYHRRSALFRILYSDTHDFEDFSKNGVIRLGDVDLNNHRCNAYLAFYKATIDLERRTSRHLRERVTVYVDEDDVYQPRTEYVNVLSNDRFIWNLETAQHELAHVIRHVFDGDEEHFLDDRDLYQSEDYKDHNCSLETSIQFAFNEGWAMYWAHQCREQEHDDRMNVAGNVAQALRNLQSRYRKSDADMVKVLEDNPYIIHSYAEFESKLLRNSAR
ncbi:hypothetical protein FGB62_134g017 [Gracilaria domingensis]|nr:hypothetical protein FGB62_134g017 [Gracilaria domingensis]